MEAETPKNRKKLCKILIVFLILAFLIVGGWFVLFQWNQFTLVIQLRGEPNDTAPGFWSCGYLGIRHL